MGSPAATARAARSAANCSPLRSKRARAEAASCGDSAATASQPHSSLPRAGKCTPTGFASRTRRRSAKAWATKEASGTACSESLAASLGQNLGAVLFARDWVGRLGFQQTAQLPSKDRRLGGQVVVEVIRFRDSAGRRRPRLLHLKPSTERPSWIWQGTRRPRGYGWEQGHSSKPFCVCRMASMATALSRALQPAAGEIGRPSIRRLQPLPIPRGKYSARSRRRPPEKKRESAWQKRWIRARGRSSLGSCLRESQKQPLEGIVRPRVRGFSSTVVSPAA